MSWPKFEGKHQSVETRRDAEIFGGYFWLVSKSLDTQLRAETGVSAREKVRRINY